MFQLGNKHWINGAQWEKGWSLLLLQMCYISYKRKQLPSPACGSRKDQYPPLYAEPNENYNSLQNSNLSFVSLKFGRLDTLYKSWEFHPSGPRNILPSESNATIGFLLQLTGWKQHKWMLVISLDPSIQKDCKRYIFIRYNQHSLKASSSAK